MSHKDVTKTERIRGIAEDICDMLEEKNISYGDNIADPVNIFNDLPPEVALEVRIDDKISRIARGDDYGNEDTLKDLVGYLLRLIEVRQLPLYRAKMKNTGWGLLGSQETRLKTRP